MLIQDAALKKNHINYNCLKKRTLSLYTIYRRQAWREMLIAKLLFKRNLQIRPSSLHSRFPPST